jgi:hypothetical protein
MRDKSNSWPAKPHQGDGSADRSQGMKGVTGMAKKAAKKPAKKAAKKKAKKC